MRPKQPLLYPIFLLCLTGCLCAQPWSGILDPTRAIDWSTAGIPGGIPTNRTQCGSTITATGSDQTSQIQTALNGCGSDHFVLLAAGTFQINTGLAIPSNVTLRGSGAHNTILNENGSGTAFITMGTANDVNPASTQVTITAGTGAGSTSITVSSASGFSVGNLVHINELNDTFVSPTGAGTCSWCDEWWNGTRLRGQISEVTSVNGTTIGINPGLYHGYTHTPMASPIAALTKRAGVENLQVYANPGHNYSMNFAMKQCSYCWLRGIESNFSTADHAEIWYSYHNEIRDSYFHDSFVHSSGGTDSDVWVGQRTTGSLIENNIFTRLHLSVDLNRGPAGNVIAYNYMDGCYDSGSTNVLMFDMASHGAHPQYNLWEGNVFPQIRVETYWGSVSWSTLFRNWAVGIANICLPYNTRGAAGACHVSTQGNDAIEVDALAYQSNLVGNIAGSAVLHASGPEVAFVAANEGRSNYGGIGYDIGVGYIDVSDGVGSYTCTGTRSSCMPFTSGLYHGNYTNSNGISAWEYNVTPGHNPTHPSQTLPASFYKSSKPLWWGSLPWPAIGPDVTGGTGPGGHASLTASNPAQLCYQGSKDGSGYLIFDAGTCYPQQAGPGNPNPPTNLTVTAR
jgi:hypothetical protein